jgi:geranylgeranyl reductase family protein
MCRGRGLIFTMINRSAEPVESCDVLIVGGGPAGSSCAWRLKQAGLDVLVLDKSVFPRDKVCAGWVTPQVTEALQFDLNDYKRRDRTFQPITGFTTGFMEPIGIQTLYEKPVSYGIRRCEFDHYLLERSGARLRLGEPLKSMVRRGAGWLINGSIETPLVVGAGGHFCPVARLLGARLGRDEQVISASEIEFELDADQGAKCRVTPDMPELFFCADLKGYGWCFRKGNYLNVGLGREDNHRLSEQVDAFCQFLRSHAKIPADMPDRFKGHAYLLNSHARRRLLDDGVLLIGDAAGLAYPQSGEGIRPAVESGLMAAAVISEAARDYRSEKLAPYVARLSARFGTPGTKNGMAQLVPPKLKTLVGRRLMASGWFARNVVLDRWFLHADLPALRAD